MAVPGLSVVQMSNLVNCAPGYSDDAVAMPPALADATFCGARAAGNRRAVDFDFVEAGLGLVVRGQDGEANHPGGNRGESIDIARELDHGANRLIAAGHGQWLGSIEREIELGQLGFEDACAAPAIFGVRGGEPHAPRELRRRGSPGDRSSLFA